MYNALMTSPDLSLARSEKSRITPELKKLGEVSLDLIPSGEGIVIRVYSEEMRQQVESLLPSLQLQCNYDLTVFPQVQSELAVDMVRRAFEWGDYMRRDADKD